MKHIKHMVVLTTMIMLLLTGCVFQNNYSEKPKVGTVKLTVKVKKSITENPVLVFEEYDYVKIWAFAPSKSSSFGVLATILAESDDDVEDFIEPFADPDADVDHDERDVEEKLLVEDIEDFILEDVPVDTAYIAVGIPGEGYDVQFFNVNGKITPGGEYELEMKEYVKEFPNVDFNFDFEEEDEDAVVLQPRPNKSMTAKFVPQMVAANTVGFVSIAGDYNWDQYNEDYEMTDTDGDGVYEYYFSGIAPGTFLYKFNPRDGDIPWGGVSQGWTADPVADGLRPVPGYEGKYNSEAVINGVSDSRYVPVVTLSPEEVPTEEAVELTIDVNFTGYMAAGPEDALEVKFSIKDYQNNQIEVTNLDENRNEVVVTPVFSNGLYRANLILPAMEEGMETQLLNLDLSVVDPNGKSFSYLLQLTQSENVAVVLNNIADVVLEFDSAINEHSGSVTIDVNNSFGEVEQYIYSVINPEGELVEGFPYTTDEKEYTWEISKNVKETNNMAGEYTVYVDGVVGTDIVDRSPYKTFVLSYPEALPAVVLPELIVPDNVSIVGGITTWEPADFDQYHMTNVRENVWVMDYVHSAGNSFKFALNDNWNELAPYSQYGPRLEVRPTTEVAVEDPSDETKDIEDPGTSIDIAIDGDGDAYNFSGERESYDGRLFNYGLVSNPGDQIYGNVEYATQNLGGANNAVYDEFVAGAKYRIVLNLEKDGYTYTNEQGNLREVGAHQWSIEFLNLITFDILREANNESYFAMGEEVTLNANVAAINDVAGAGASYEWEILIDGVIDDSIILPEEANVKFVPTVAGEYVIRLTVNGTETYINSMTVGAPLAVIGETTVGNTVTLESRGTAAQYIWTIIPPEGQVIGMTGQEVSYMFEELGNHRIVVNADGIISETTVDAGIDIELQDVYNILQGEEIELKVRYFGDNGDNSEFDNVSWFIDGEILDEKRESFTWKEEEIRTGSHKVKLIVDADAGVYETENEFELQAEITIEDEEIDVLTGEYLEFELKDSMSFVETELRIMRRDIPAEGETTEYELVQIISASNELSGTWIPGDRPYASEEEVLVYDGDYKVEAVLSYNDVDYISDNDFDIVLNYTLSDSEGIAIEDIKTNTEYTLDLVNEGITYKDFDAYQWKFVDVKGNEVVTDKATTAAYTWVPEQAGETVVTLRVEKDDEIYVVEQTVLVAEDYIAPKYNGVTATVGGTDLAMTYIDGRTWEVYLEGAGETSLAFVAEDGTTFGGKDSAKRGIISSIGTGVATDYDGYLSLNGTNEITINTALEAGKIYSVQIDTDSLLYRVIEVKEINLVGSLAALGLNDWNPAENAMTYIGNGVWEITTPDTIVTEDTEIAFKFAVNGGWTETAYGAIETDVALGVASDVQLDPTAGNFAMTVKADRAYVYRINLLDMSASVREKVDTVNLVGTLSAFGSSDWDPSLNEMTALGDGKYELEVVSAVTEDTEIAVKFAVNGGWVNTAFGAIETDIALGVSGDVTLDPTAGNFAMTVKADRSYVFTLDTEAMTYNVVEKVNTVNLVGTLSAFGSSDWDPSLNEMTALEDGKYEIEVVSAVTEDTEIAFKFAVNGGWVNTAFGAIETDIALGVSGDVTLDPTAGNFAMTAKADRSYIFTLDTEAMTYKVIEKVDTVNLVGTLAAFGSSDWDPSLNAMDREGSGVFSLEMTATTDAEIAFKFAVNAGWINTAFGAVDGDVSLEVPGEVQLEATAGNFSLEVSSGTKYKFIVDTINLTYVVKIAE